jgi:rsbT co-antagonist protein RsbR
MTIADLEARLQALTGVLERLGLGKYDLEIAAGDDALGSVEEGVNGLVLDLQALHLANQEKAAYLELQQRDLTIRADQLRAQADTIREQQRLLDAREQELTTMMATIRSQSEAIRELNVPIIEVEDGVIALPMIGTLDARRARDTLETLLPHVAGHASRHVIIDLTGVTHIDTQTAEYLEKIVQAVRLIGARCLISGLNPATAQTLVQLGVGLAHLRTFRTLKGGLRDSLRATASAATRRSKGP